MSTDLVFVSVSTFGAVVATVWATRAAYLRWRSSFTENARLSLEDMFLFVDPRSVFRVNLFMFMVVPGAIWLWTGLPLLALLAFLGGLAVPRAAWRVLRSRRIRKLILQLPDAMSMMAGSLRAGASLQTALDNVVQDCPAPLSQEFSMLLREQRLGLALEDSLRGMAQRLDAEEVDLFVSAVSIAHEVGGGLAETLERLALSLRTKLALEGKIRALTSQGKMQGVIVGLLPVFLGAAFYFMDPVSMTPLFTTPYGWGVMGALLVMLGLGAIFIRKIVTIDV
jgi:tight adherence protein B